MKSNISKVINKFTDEPLTEKLPGGSNESFKAGKLVFKPILEKEKYEWIGNVFENITSEGILIARPIKSKVGNYIEDGYGAGEYIPGEFFPHRISEKLQAAAIFHEIVSSIEKPNEFNLWISPWSLSNQAAWSEMEIPASFNTRARHLLEGLKKQIIPIDLKTQFVHSDLAGNILFNGATPVIIDISPEFRPLEYAHTLLVTDSIAWHNEPVDSINLLPYSPELRHQLVLRAVIFRLCVPLFFNSNDYDGFITELENFKPVLEFEKIRYETEGKS